MKKKISLLISVFVLILGLSGCGNSKETIDYDSETLEKYAEAVIGGFSQMGEEDFASFRDGSDLEVNLSLMQTGLPVEKDEFVAMMDAWNAAITECGDYKKHGEYKIEATDSEVVVSTLATYEERKATIELKFDDKLNMESMDVSAKYTTGEILEKAGLNTLLGMGTVFAVLIFLAFLISLIKYIPVMVDKLTGKGRKAVQETAPQKAETVMTVEEEPADDLELVAVITAAIAAQEGVSTDGFVVRSIRRRASNNWNQNK